MDFVGLIEQRFWPQLREGGEHIAKEFPSVAVNVSSYEGGKLTNNLAHGFAIDCYLRVRHSRNDNVALLIYLEHLEGEPTISASVIWGAPSGYTEFEVYEDNMPVTEEVLSEIEDKLPSMLDTLKSVLSRGKPSNE